MSVKGTTGRKQDQSRSRGILDNTAINLYSLAINEMLLVDMLRPEEAYVCQRTCSRWVNVLLLVSTKPLAETGVTYSYCKLDPTNVLSPIMKEYNNFRLWK